MTRLVGLFFALAMLLGCGGEPVAVQRGAALQPPIACCVPQRLPESAWCSPSSVPGDTQFKVCSSDQPLYRNPVCALLTEPATPNLVSNGWTSNGWGISSVTAGARVGVQVGVGGVSWNTWCAGPCSLSFVWADRITDVWSWAQ